MNNQHIFLSYNVWDGDYHKGYNLDHKNLQPYQVQAAIDEYIVRKEETLSDNKRLALLVDELMNENKNLRKLKEFYQERYDSD